MHYHFVDDATFDAMLERAEFLESALVHGHHYATSRQWLEDEMMRGHDVLLEIDVQGAEQVRKLIPSAVGIFILPPSWRTVARTPGRPGPGCPAGNQSPARRGQA